MFVDDPRLVQMKSLTFANCHTSSPIVSPPRQWLVLRPRLLKHGAVGGSAVTLFELFLTPALGQIRGSGDFPCVLSVLPVGGAA